MAGRVQFELVTPERLLVSREVEMVVVPGAEGNFGVLPGHAPLISTIRPGTIDIYEGRAVTERIFVVGGIAEVTPERCTVLADEALPVSSLDRTAIEAQAKTLESLVAGLKEQAPRLAGIETLDCIQWIQGAGAPLPSEWTGLLRKIQAAGKTVQVMYAGAHGGHADFNREIEALCGALDPTRLFISAEVDTVEKADFIVRYAREACRGARTRPL